MATSMAMFLLKKSKKQFSVEFSGDLGGCHGFLFDAEKKTRTTILGNGSGNGVNPKFNRDGDFNGASIYDVYILVGGMEYELYFSIRWECQHPN